MATTFVEYTGDGNATKQFTFPSYQESDVKVRVDGVLKTTSTHYNITGYTTTGGGNVVFTSGNIPSSPANIRIYRDTNVDTAKATFTAGSSVKAADLNNNTTQLLYRAQEEQIPNLIHSYDIDDGAVTAAKFAADSVTGAKIADDSINSEHYVDGSIDTAHIADAQITTAKIAADAVTGAKIADDQINSEHYVDGSIDTAHIADAQITTAKIADGAVTSAKLASGAVATGDLADGLISTAKIAADAVTNAKIADDSIDSEHYVDGSIDEVHLNNNIIGSAKLINGAVITTKISDTGVTTPKIADLAVTTDKLANNAVTAAKIASNAVTTDKIADGELTTLAGMQSTTASNLASSTALTATTAELNQLDGITLETSVTTNSDTRIPTSKAVNDLVLSVTNALGGFVAIANETSFPTTNPDPSNNAGTVVSISQLSTGLAVSGSGVATISNGAGTGNTVTITGFPANLQSQTLPASSGLQVQTTSTLHTYTFHKQLASAADIQAISATVNSFSNRYRVSASAPTSSLDGGDLWYDTTNSKLMVYSSQNSAWEESSAIGNFFISTISSSSNTGGGSATPNGTAYRFTISDAPTSAQQLIVSVDGVIQKPNSGSSQPSEGFVLVGNDIIFGAAPANGASIFVTVIGSTVGIGTPSNNTVTTAILQNGSVTTAKIVDANVTTAKITDANVTTAKIADGAVTTAKIANSAVTTNKIAAGAISAAKIADATIGLDKLHHGTSSNDGKFLRANNGADPSFETVNTDLVSDTSPQLGGDLDTNSHHILIDDDHKIKFGDSSDLEIYHSGNFNFIVNNNSKNLAIQAKSGENAIVTIPDAEVQLYHNNVKKFETNSAGVHVHGNMFIEDGSSSTNKITLGTGGDLNIYHDGSNSFISETGTGVLKISGSAGVYINKYDNTETMAAFLHDAGVELYHNNVKKFETTSTGAKISGTGAAFLEITTTSGSHNPMFRGSNGDRTFDTGLRGDTGDAWCVYDATAADVRFMIDTSGNVSIPNDNIKLKIGAGDDLQIYHDSSTGYNHINFANGPLVFTDQSTHRAFFHGTDGHFLPWANNTYDLGSTSNRWRNIYTNDLNLSNEGSSNDVDGSWGDWTIQEGESDLFLKNNRSGKKYKFNLTEVS